MTSTMTTTTTTTTTTTSTQTATRNITAVTALAEAARAGLMTTATSSTMPPSQTSHYPDPLPKKYPGQGLKIIHASFFRMATKSMATAYAELGFAVHHGLRESLSTTRWDLLEEASEATYPDWANGSPGSAAARSAPRRPPHTRKDWDVLFGDRYDVATDLACPYTFELIKAYPDAKVVIVQRDFEAWWPSFETQIRDTGLPEPAVSVAAWLMWNCMGIRAGYSMRKALRGMFRVETCEELDKERARMIYDEFFDRVRREVPEERRLEFVVGQDGFEKLCGFLEVPVPVREGEDGNIGVLEFPYANHRKLHNEETWRRQMELLRATAKACGMVGAVVLGTALAGWRLTC